MTWEWSETYWQAITQLEAQELLLGLRLAQVPQTKEAGLERWHRELHKMAYPKTYDPSAPVLSTKAFADKLKEAIGG